MRIVQAGLGLFGRGWARSLRAAVGIELVAVVDPEPAARDWAVEGLGLAPGRCFAAIDEALARVGCDAALVVTPPATHRAVAEAALAAGKHVLVEKPLTTDLADAVALVAAARAAGRTLMVSQNYRYRRAARRLRDLVADGRLGALVAVKVACRRDVRDLLAAGDFRWGMRHPYLFEMGIHHLDLLRTIAGRDVATVSARSWPIPHSGFAHHPAVSALLTLDGGAVVTYEGALTPYGPETSWNGEWELLGETGRVRWVGNPADWAGGEVIHEAAGREPEFVPMPEWPTDDRSAVLAAFRAALATGEEPETAGADNLRSLAAVLAAARSTESGEEVDVERLLAAAVAAEPGGDGAPGVAEEPAAEGGEGGRRAA